MRIAIALAVVAVGSLFLARPALADDGTGIHVGAGAGPNGVGVGAGAGINGTGVSTGAGIGANGAYVGADAGRGAYNNSGGYYLDGRYYPGTYDRTTMQPASYTYSTGGYYNSGYSSGYSYGNGYGSRGWNARNSGYTGSSSNTYSGYSSGYGSSSNCGCDPCRSGLFGHGGFLGTGLFR